MFAFFLSIQTSVSQCKKLEKQAKNLFVYYDKFHELALRSLACLVVIGLTAVSGEAGLFKVFVVDLGNWSDQQSHQY